MNKKQAQEVAEQVVEYLFSDGTNKPVDRLMLVYGGQDFKNPGWGREAIKDTIVKHILQSAQQSHADGANS